MKQTHRTGSKMVGCVNRRTDGHGEPLYWGFVLLLVMLAYESGCTSVRYTVDRAPADYQGLLWSYRSPSAGIEQVEFSPDGRYLFVRGTYASRVLATRSGRIVSTFDNAGEWRRPLEYFGGAIVILPMWIASTHTYRRFKAASSESKPQSMTPKTQPNQPKVNQRSLYSWSGDSQFLFHVDTQCALHTYRADNGRHVDKQQIELEEDESIRGVSSSGKVVAIHQTGDDHVGFVSLDRSWERKYPAGTDVSFSNSASAAALTRPDGTVEIIDLDDGSVSQSLAVDQDARVSIGDKAKLLLICKCQHDSYPARTMHVAVQNVNTGKIACAFDPQASDIGGHIRRWSSA